LLAYLPVFCLLTYSQVMRKSSILSVSFALVVGTLFVGPVAYASTPEPDEIVSCDISGADLRGEEVCFIDATVTRGGTTLSRGTDYKLYYQDQDAAFGEGSAGFVVFVGFDLFGTISPYGSGQAGDVVELTLAYPVLDRDPAGDVEGLRGTDVAAGVFAITTAADFSFTKTLESSGSDNWVEFDISQTFVTDWSRGNDCFFAGFDDDTGYGIPSPGCESENGVNGITSDAFVSNFVSFFTPETFPGFVTETTDGGYLNYRGSGLSWFNDNNSFQFQLIGPSYADGSNRNTGSLQAFLPEPYMREIYGADFSPSAPSWQPARLDLSDEGLLSQDLSSQLVTSERNGGLLIELASYQFSAPVFSFASISGSSGGSGSALTPGVPGIFLSVNGVLLGKQAEGSPVYFGADRVAVTSTYELVVIPVSHSSQTRVSLAQGTIGANGSFSSMVRLPNLAPGTYDIRMSGRHVNGATLELTSRVTIVDGVLASIGANVPVIR
jgi:hypothetical protein